MLVELPGIAPNRISTSAAGTRCDNRRLPFSWSESLASRHIRHLKSTVRTDITLALTFGPGEIPDQQCGHSRQRNRPRGMRMLNTLLWQQELLFPVR